MDRGQARRDPADELEAPVRAAQGLAEPGEGEPLEGDLPALVVERQHLRHDEQPRAKADLAAGHGSHALAPARTRLLNLHHHVVADRDGSRRGRASTAHGRHSVGMAVIFTRRASLRNPARLVVRRHSAVVASIHCGRRKETHRNFLAGSGARGHLEFPQRPSGPAHPVRVHSRQSFHRVHAARHAAQRASPVRVDRRCGRAPPASRPHDLSLLLRRAVPGMRFLDRCGGPHEAARPSGQRIRDQFLEHPSPAVRQPPAQCRAGALARVDAR